MSHILKFQKTIVPSGNSKTLSSVPPEVLTALKLEIGDSVEMIVDHSEKHKTTFCAFWKKKK